MGSSWRITAVLPSIVGPNPQPLQPHPFRAGSIFSRKDEKGIGLPASGVMDQTSAPSPGRARIRRRSVGVGTVLSVSAFFLVTTAISVEQVGAWASFTPSSSSLAAFSNPHRTDTVNSSRNHRFLCTSCGGALPPLHSTTARGRPAAHEIRGGHDNSSATKRLAAGIRRHLPGKGSMLWKLPQIVLAVCALAALIVSFFPSPAVAAKEAVAAAATATATATATAEVPLHGTAAASLSAAASSPIRSPGEMRLLPTKAEVDMSLRLLFASLGGAAVGLERSSSDRPAGVRTMALVSLGAAAFTICSMYGFLGLASSIDGAKFDPSRMASNVASGVGFIGAGVITNNRKSAGVYDRQSSVNGLTTAAAIWVSSAIGVACGVGLYVVGTTAALSTIAILRLGRVSSHTVVQNDMSVGKKRPKKASRSVSAAAATGTPTTFSAVAGATGVAALETSSPPALNATDSLDTPVYSTTPVQSNALPGDAAVSAHNECGAEETCKKSRGISNGANESERVRESVGTTILTTSSLNGKARPSESSAARTNMSPQPPAASSTRSRKGKSSTHSKQNIELISDPLIEKFLWGDGGEIEPMTNIVSAEGEQEVVTRSDKYRGPGEV